MTETDTESVRFVFLIWVCLVYCFLYLGTGCSATLYEIPRTPNSLRHKTTISMGFDPPYGPFLVQMTRTWD